MLGYIRKWFSAQWKSSAPIKGAPAIFSSIIVIVFPLVLIIASFCWYILIDHESVPEFILVFCLSYFGIAFLIRWWLVKSNGSDKL